MMSLDRVLLHLADYRRIPIEPAKVYFLEAAGDETLVRTRTRRVYRDVRALGEVERSFAPHGFVRVHRNYAVNLRRIREIRQRKSGEGWQLKLQPPVNQVLPIGDTYTELLWQAFAPRAAP